MSQGRRKTSGLQRKKTDAMPLSELIDAIKRDLWEAHQAQGAATGTATPKMFRIAEATVEASIYFERSLEPGGEINVFVAKIGAKAAETSQAAHKVSVKLSPLGPGDLQDPDDWRARGGPRDG